MSDFDILIPASVLSILRRENSVRGVAERLGVSEAQVHEWMDMFVIGGTLAVTRLRSQGKSGDRRQRAQSAIVPSGMHDESERAIITTSTSTTIPPEHAVGGIGQKATATFYGEGERGKSKMEPFAEAIITTTSSTTESP